MTLREVGARAGVSRSAPYRHFPDKESLLTAVAAEAWTDLGDQLQTLATRTDHTPEASLQAALGSLLATARSRQHLYRLMFRTPANDPAAVVGAAERTQDLFLELVARVTGPHRARRYGALLLASAHGIAALELSGHLGWDKWQSTADDLIDILIELLPPGS